MSVSAWGLLLDLIGVAAVGWAEWASPGLVEDEDGDYVFDLNGTDTARKWLRRVGWLLLVAGFALQLGGELMQP